MNWGSIGPVPAPQQAIRISGTDNLSWIKAHTLKFGVDFRNT
jgi:hypothetical protein